MYGVHKYEDTHISPTFQGFFFTEMTVNNWIFCKSHFLIQVAAFISCGNGRRVEKHFQRSEMVGH